MEKNNISIWIPVLWFVSGCGWGFVLASDFKYGMTSAVLTTLHALTTFMSFVAAIVNYNRYKNQKTQ